MVVYAGSLDRKIVIQKKSAEGNALGGNSSETWVTHLTVWAMYIPGMTSEFKEGASNFNRTVAKFRIYYTSTLLPDMRISFDSKLWRITGFVEIGRKEGLEIDAELIL